MQKLISSNSDEDIKLGLAYLSRYIEENSIENLNINEDGMVANCTALIDFKHKKDEWFLVLNRKKEFCLNLGWSQNKGAYVVYSWGTRFKDIVYRFSDEVIHEDI